MPRNSTEDGPHPVDKHVGERIRIRRAAIHMTQGILAKKVNLTFQQVQKYEKGTNRVSCSKIFEIAVVLDVPVAFFFEGLKHTGGEGSAEIDLIHSIMSDRESLEFLKTYDALTPEKQASLRMLVKTLIQ